MSNVDPLFAPRMEMRGRSREQLKSKWGWIVALGLVFLLAGVVALYNVTTATLVTVLWIGAAMIVAGGMEIVTAFQVRDWSRAIFLGVLGAVTVLAGVVTFQNPALAAISLTTLIAVALIAAGVLKFIIAWHIRDLGPWALVALSGAVSLLLGVLLLAEWPISGMYALGLFMAVTLVMEGAAWLVTGFALKADYPGASEAL